MTTATLVAGNRTLDTETGRPRRSLEELVDQLFAAMGFADETVAEEQSAARSIHEARRLKPTCATVSIDDGMGPNWLVAKSLRLKNDWPDRSKAGSLSHETNYH